MIQGPPGRVPVGGEDCVIGVVEAAKLLDVPEPDVRKAIHRRRPALNTESFFQWLDRAHLERWWARCQGDDADMAHPVEHYSIGSDVWSGLSKLVEGCGETMQVAGKLMGTGGQLEHWDGSHLGDQLHEELGDLLGAIRFFVEVNDLDVDRIEVRRVRKLALFYRWQQEQSAARSKLERESP